MGNGESWTREAQGGGYKYAKGEKGRGTYGEDVLFPQSVSHTNRFLRVLAEFLGTLLVAFVSGVALQRWGFDGALRITIAAGIYGLAVYLFGTLTWAHFDPAVTLGWLFTGMLSRRRAHWDVFYAVFYLLAQAAGTLLGVLLTALWIHSDPAKLSYPPVHVGWSQGSQFINWMLIAFLWVMVANLLEILMYNREASTGRMPGLLYNRAIMVIVARTVLIAMSAHDMGGELNLFQNMWIAVFAPGGTTWYIMLAGVMTGVAVATLVNSLILFLGARRVVEGRTPKADIDVQEPDKDYSSRA